MIEKKAGRVRGRWYSCVKPNIGYSPIEYSKSDLESKFVKVDDIADLSLHNEVKEEWTKLYEAGDNGKCMHYTCSNPNCEYGKRIRKQGLITGSVMPIWGDLTKVILGSHRNLDKDFLKIAKGKMGRTPGKESEETIVGVLCRSDLKETLATKIQEKRKEFSEATCCKKEESIAFQVVNQVGFLVSVFFCDL
jgi:hypothetical protein